MPCQFFSGAMNWAAFLKKWRIFATLSEKLLLNMENVR